MFFADFLNNIVTFAKKRLGETDSIIGHINDEAKEHSGRIDCRHRGPDPGF